MKAPDVAPESRQARLVHGMWLAATIAAGLLAAVGAVKDFHHQEGDASVYWVFARSMWTDGLFHFGRSGTSHGATSPLWALLLSIVQLGSAEPFFIWKVTGLAIWAAVCWSTFRLGKRMTGSTSQALAATSLMLVFQPMRRYAGATYETPLITLLVSEAVLLTVAYASNAGRHARTWPWLAVLSLLPLARPEGLAALLILGAIGLVCSDRPRARLLAGLALAVLPSAAFYFWMFRQTGILIPSSISARQLLSVMHDQYLAPVSPLRIVARCAGVVFQGASANWKVSNALQAAAIGLGIVSFRESQPVFLRAYLALSAFFAVMMVANNPGYYAERYACPLAPMGLVMMMHGAFAAGQLARRLGRPGGPVRWAGYGALAACGIALLSPPASASARAALSPPAIDTDVLDQSGAQSLNQVLKPSDVVLVYEVQTAYYLNARTMSADGIVGGQITPYLRRGNIEEFVNTYGVTRVLTSNAFNYRTTFKGTILEALATGNATLPVGGRMRLGGLSFRKLANRDRPQTSAQWTAVYAVE